MKIHINIFFIGLLVLAFTNSCKSSPRMSDEEKSAFLKEKFMMSPFAKDSSYNSESLKYIYGEIDDKLYCEIEGDYLAIFRYNPKKNHWTTMTPNNDYTHDGFDEHNLYNVHSLEEYRLKGNKLYCKYSTGQCGMGFQAIAFYYLDLDNGIWHFLTNGTEASEFSGDTIVADIRWIEKEVYDEQGDGDTYWSCINYDKSVFGDSIKLIIME